MKRLLFVSPAVPRPTGGGLRMRAWLFLRALAQNHRVTLVAGSPSFPAETEAELQDALPLVEDAVLLPWPRTALLGRTLSRWCGIRSQPVSWADASPRLRSRLKALRDCDFSRVHVFRLYMLPVAEAASNARIELDLDESESRTLLSLATLGKPGSLRADAAWFEIREREALARVSRVFVASAVEAHALARETTVVENAVPMYPLVPAPLDARDLLLVGSLGYEPNAEGVRFLLDAVLPLLPKPYRLVVAGTGAPPALRQRLRAHPDVRFLDAPAAVTPLYASAAAVLAPIRAGGGTRVKVLEALAHGRPLIATAKAVEGLALEPGSHFVIAESAPDWVEACRLLLADPGRGAQIAAAGHAWVQRHDLEAAVARLARLTS